MIAVFYRVLAISDRTFSFDYPGMTYGAFEKSSKHGKEFAKTHNHGRTLIDLRAKVDRHSFKHTIVGNSRHDQHLRIGGSAKDISTWLVGFIVTFRWRRDFTLSHAS